MFEGSEVVARVIEELASASESREDPWKITRPLSTGNKNAAQIQLELRVATEADRKDTGHSGHTDSVYYAQNKEQQALDRQRLEERRQKKRLRVRRLPEANGEEKTV